MPPAFSTFSPTLFLIGAVLIAVAYIALIYYKRSRQLKDLEAQGIAESPFKRHPIFGHAMHMRELGFSRFVLQSSVLLGPERGRIFAVCIGPIIYLVSTDPDVMQTVTKTNNLPKGVYHNLTPILGSGLLTNRGGEDWKRKRILFMEAFSVPYLKQVVPPAVTGVSSELVKRIDASIAKNQSVDIQSVLLLCSLDLIGLVGFGHDFGCTRGDVDADVLTMMHVCLKEPTVRFFNPFARFYRLREAAEFNRQLKAFKNFALDVIRANKIPDISGERRKNILSVALSSTRAEKKGHEFSDAELVNEVSTFLFAGHETTGATMCFAVLMLGVDPAWQAKARAEVDSVMGDRLIPTFEDQNRLHTLGNIIKEILRLFPAAPGSLRVAQEDTRVLEYTVPKGTNVMPVFMAMQRHPRNFPDVKKFDPTRWEKVESDEGRADEPVSKDESTKSPHTYAYVPFSAGPRNCIGMHFANMEMRLIIARLLRRYTWTIEILEPGVEATPEGIMEYYEEEVTVHAKPFKTHFTVRKGQL